MADEEQAVGQAAGIPRADVSAAFRIRSSTSAALSTSRTSSRADWSGSSCAVSFRENHWRVVSLSVTRWPSQHAQARRQDRLLTPQAGTSPRLGAVDNCLVTGFPDPAQRLGPLGALSNKRIGSIDSTKIVTCDGAQELNPHKVAQYRAVGGSDATSDSMVQALRFYILQTGPKCSNQLSARSVTSQAPVNFGCGPATPEAQSVQPPRRSLSCSTTMRCRWHA